ncbi:hypothetical protein [Nitrosovibrio sp. Nv6]|uniref:hypothetical protein n=1 Tax=Nitrosovibrio sp. Nv6 TaxID=1855340 RepID=UPI0008C22F65|nr:hypothetical protein [Nitrosovibrio sp. Nv6]SEP42851.1 hypothetical protein SAMN05216316_3053 [Nitrosovibrio sp. Nv6]
MTGKANRAAAGAACDSKERDTWNFRGCENLYEGFAKGIVTGWPGLKARCA